VEMNASRAVRDSQASWLPFRAKVDQNLFPPRRQPPAEQIRELMAGEAVSERHLVELIDELHVSTASSAEGHELLSQLLVHEGSSWRTKQAAIWASLPLLDSKLLDWHSLTYRFKDEQYQGDKGYYGLNSIQRLVTLYGRMIGAISQGVVIQVNKESRLFLDTLLDVYKHRNEGNLRQAYKNKGVDEWPFPAISVMRAVVILREYSSLERTVPYYPENGKYLVSGIQCAIPPLWWVLTRGLEETPREAIKHGLDLHAVSVFERMYENTPQSELPGSGLYELLAQGDADPKAVYERLTEWFLKPWINEDGSLR
jgi:hypothetical protein